jgi:hypothetical protein
MACETTSESCRRRAISIEEVAKSVAARSSRVSAARLLRHARAIRELSDDERLYVGGFVVDECARLRVEPHHTKRMT